MPNHEEITLEQIKLASKLTGSALAVVAQVGAKGWEFPLVHKLNKKKRAVLDNYVKLKAVQTILQHTIFGELKGVGKGVKAMESSMWTMCFTCGPDPAQALPEKQKPGCNGPPIKGKVGL